MKKILIAVCAILIAGSVFANFGGTDDFNDNSIDTGKWFDAESGFSEANQRLEYTNSLGFGQGTWAWDLNEGSYVADWAVEIDVSSALNPTSWDNQSVLFGLSIQGPNPPQDRFNLWFEIADESGDKFRSIFSQVGDDTGTETGFDMGANNTAKLGLSFDAETKIISAAYDIGSGYIGLSTFNVGTSDWNMGAEDGFNLYVYASALNMTVASGDIYGDNFAAVPEPATFILMAIAGASLFLKKAYSRR